jgi:hypothetical protein
MINISSIFSTLLNKAKSLVMEEISPEVTGGLSTPESVPNEPLAAANPVTDTQTEPVKKLTPIRVVSAIFNGMGIGLLLGTLVSLSLSPVVAGVIGTVSSLLAVFLGLNEKYIDPLKSIRIGSFGLFAVVGVIMGLYIRAHDPLAPSLLDKKNEFLKLGFTDEQAKAFIMKKVQADTGKNLSDDNVLYNSSQKKEDCESLQQITEDWTVEEMYPLFEYVQGTWKKLKDNFITDLADRELIAMSLIVVRDCFCGINSDDVFEMDNMDEIKKLGSSDSVQNIEDVLSSSASGEKWQTLVKNMRQSKIPENKRNIVYLSIINVLGNE